MYQDLPAHLPSHYGVIGVRPFSVAPDTVALSAVYPHGPATRAGLRPGDRLIAVPPYRIRTPDELSRCIQSFPPGTAISLVIRRDGQRLERNCTVTDVRHLHFLMAEQGQVPGSLPADRHRRWSETVAPLERVARELIETQAAAGAAAALLDALSMDAGRYAGDCRLQDVHYALHNPLKGTRIADALAAEFDTAADLETHLTAAAMHLDLASTAISAVMDEESAPAFTAEALSPLLDPDQPRLSRQLLIPFFTAGLQTARAFSALSMAERRDLFAGIPLLLDRFATSFYLADGDSAETAAHIQTLRLAKQVDLAALFAGATLLSHLTTPQALRETRRLVRRLKTRLPELPPTLGGEFIYAHSTPAGWVLVGDTGPNYYGERACLIIDLGGDDIYCNEAGAARPSPETEKPWLPASLIIDYGGDDRYIGEAVATAGAGLGGVGLLLDLQGNDLYLGGRLTQAAAFCGIGVLWDQRGDDLYLADDAAQGTAFFGAGLLLDDNGADLYAAAQCAQAFGGSRGIGLLVDRRGDDRFLADRRVPSTYGTPDIYRGWAQGVGCGFRGFSSGGIGLLYDGSGDDDYQAGNFSQGTGYFFGMGMLVDGSGDDFYRGSRYAQGAGAHQAVGILVDDAGSDRYQGSVAASQGAAWDAAVGVLEDRQGDDVYRGNEFAQGAGAMNGLGLLVDWKGEDQYRAGSGQGYGNGTAYWGGRQAGNLGLLIDAGNQADTYDLEGRKDRSSSKRPDIGLFLDR